MNRNILCWLLFSVAISTWLQAASGKYIQHDEGNYMKTLFQDEYFREENDRKDDQPAITKKDLPKNGELFEGDIVMDDTIRNAVLGIKNEKRSGIFDSKVGNPKHWPGGVVPYTLNSNLKPIVRSQILKGIRELAKVTCVKFIPKRDQDVDYVDFQDGKGCSSSVGRQGGEQVIHLGEGCKRIGTVIHEMMHTIGIIHEQSRPDRDDHVLVRFDHIKQALQNNFRKYEIDEADNMDIPYNFYSVMHYSNHAFSNDDEVTLVAKSDKSLKFGQRMQLTRMDIRQINRLYPCDKKIVKSISDILIPNMTEQDVEARKRDLIERDDRRRNRILGRIEDFMKYF